MRYRRLVAAHKADKHKTVPDFKINWREAMLDWIGALGTDAALEARSNAGAR